MFGIQGSKSKIGILVLLILLQQQYIKAQLIDMSSSGGGGGSVSLPVWGASPFQNGGADDGLIDPNWGVLPSQQGNNVNMWGQQIGMNNPNQPQTQLLDIYGNPVLMDNNGNILYDAQGNPLIDSAALNNMDQNQPNVPPPPDDPIDVPLDGGVVILFAIATGLGYKNRRLKG